MGRWLTRALISTLLLSLPIAFFSNPSFADSASLLIKILVSQAACHSVLLALPSLCARRVGAILQAEVFSPGPSERV